MRQETTALVITLIPLTDARERVFISDSGGKDARYVLTAAMVAVGQEPGYGMSKMLIPCKREVSHER